MYIRTLIFLAAIGLSAAELTYQKPPQAIEDVRVIRLVEGVIKVDVDESLEFQPAHGQVVAPGLQAVTHANSGD